MTNTQSSWSESNTQLYRKLAPVAVPARAEQIASLLTLLPFEATQPFRAVEVGCGEGLLAFALLNCFPQAELVALDGSVTMRSQANRRLQSFGERVRVEPFELASANWLRHAEGADAVLSSLCLHHLNGRQKEALFTAVAERLSPGGVLLIADLVAPQRSEARQLFAATWDRAAQAQSLAVAGSTKLFDLFVESQWNYYYFDDPFDTPSPLFDQLLWLKQAGFAMVDCFWLRAGHAIYGGYKSQSEGGGGVSFEMAQHSTEMALNTLLGRPPSLG